MRFCLAILFCVLTSAVFAGRDTVVINGTTFEFRTKGGLHSVGEGLMKELTVSRLKNGKSQRLLSHTLHQDFRDGNSISITLGAYEVVDTTLIFYTYYAKTGDAMTHPCGVQKEVYGVDKSGKVSFITCELYFNDYGMVRTDEFDGFFDESESESVKAFQEHYRGQFLEGVAGKTLDKKVRDLLATQIKEHVHKWANEFDFSDNNIFGYCW